MIIYNVTVLIEYATEKEWVEWMQSKHIPDIMSTGRFINYKMCRIITEADDGVSYAIQYTCKDMETLHEYQAKEAPELQKEHADKYAGKFAAFRTLLEVVDQNETI
jgi:hypothetical protein